MIPQMRLSFSFLIAVLLAGGVSPLAQGQIMESLDKEVYPEDPLPVGIGGRHFRGPQGGKGSIWVASGPNAHYLCLVSKKVPWPEGGKANNAATLEFYADKKPKGAPALVIQEDLSPPLRRKRCDSEEPSSKSHSTTAKWFNLAPLYDFWESHQAEELPLKGMTFSSDGRTMLRSPGKHYPYIIAYAMEHFLDAADESPHVEPGKSSE